MKLFVGEGGFSNLIPNFKNYSIYFQTNVNQRCPYFLLTNTKTMTFRVSTILGPPGRDGPMGPPGAPGNQGPAGDAGPIGNNIII